MAQRLHALGPVNRLAEPGQALAQALVLAAQVAAGPELAMARIKTTLKLADLGPSDLIIEAATERETVKQAIFEDLLPHLKPTTILTSNTSSMSETLA